MTSTAAAAHITRTTAGTWKLTGIQATTGACECCARRITQRVFEVVHPVHGSAFLGRRCAAKATGYTVNMVERMAAVEARVAEVARRREVIRAEFPDMVAVHDAFLDEARAARTAGRNPDTLPQPTAFRMVQTVATEDGWWGDRNRTAYPTWQAYVAANA